jgi:Cu+-exporting ATPase
MESQRAPSSVPPSSASFCPGCGSAVDVLRAGHVAVLDGKFRYFCDANCKQKYVTTPPPPVSHSRPVPVPENVNVHVHMHVNENEYEYEHEHEQEHEHEDEQEYEHEHEQEQEHEQEAPHFPEPKAVQLEAEPEPVSQVAPMSAAPLSVREGGVDPRRAARIAPLVLGVASVAIVLAGERAEHLRLPLAALAAIVHAAIEISRKREPGESHWAHAVGPHAIALGAAVWGWLARDPHAPAFAALVGLAAAAQSATAMVVERALEKSDRQRKGLVVALGASARVLRGGALETVLAEEVKPGEQVALDAGETAAVDGMVTAGEADVIPHPSAGGTIKKREGDAIVAGATVVKGSIKVTVTFAGAERALMRVARSMAHRADVGSQLVLIARRFLERGVALVAVCVGVAAFAQNGGPRDVLGAAAAAAVAASAAGVLGALAYCLGRAQLAMIEKGVFYKDASAFDSAGRVDVAVLCSRGTLLLGEPEVVAVETLGGLDRDRVLALAAGAETSSSHPFATAILRTVRARGLAPDAVRSAHAHTGLGVTATSASGERIVVGSRALLLQEKISVAVAESQIEGLEAQGRSVLLVALGGKLVGVVALQDGLRAGARAAVERLAAARVEPVLLSGESRETCETIARALEIDHVRPEVLPLERGAEVRALAEGGHEVAVVGHAHSDDGALGAADVSVALGAAGSAPGEWSASTVLDDVRAGVLALTAARRARELGLRVLVLGLAPGALTTLGIAFGALPLLAAPLAGLIAVLAAFAAVREPESP